METPNETPAAEQAAQPSLAEQAATRFEALLPYVKKIALAAEGKKSLVRVLHALAEFPLGATMPRLLNDNERQLFQIMQELNQYKTAIIQEVIKQSPPKPAENPTEGTKNESEEK